MAGRETSKVLAAATAAVAGVAALGYYAYDQYTKRYPQYAEQLALFKQVRRRW
jgi:uncharacterized membrane protein YebE (DUF533 family)